MVRSTKYTQSNLVDGIFGKRKIISKAAMTYLCLKEGGGKSKA